MKELCVLFTKWLKVYFFTLLYFSDFAGFNGRVTTTVYSFTVHAFLLLLTRSGTFWLISFWSAVCSGIKGSLKSGEFCARAIKKNSVQN